MSAMEDMEIQYRQEGDYLIPDLQITDTTDRPIRKYGSMRRRYLEEHDNVMYMTLLIQGNLMEHLADIEETAQEQIKSMIEEMLKHEPAPDKRTDQMGWVGHMNALHMMAEEVVTKNLIYK